MKRILFLGLAGGLSACAAKDPRAEDSGDERRLEQVAEAAQQLSPPRSPDRGRSAFETALPNSNGRSCATCHVLDEATTLRPESVAARFEADPADPLFNRLDADDPTAEKLSFDHLRKGLVRVNLPLPDNMDVIDEAGRVITTPDRAIFVWRGVPSVANVAITLPYQLDGREASLLSQARAALKNHSEATEVEADALEAIAEFQSELFSSPRARFVAKLVEFGLPLDEVPIPEEFMPLSLEEKRGRDVYDQACQPCHGSASTDRIVNRDVHDLFFSEVGPDGNVRFDVAPGQQPVAVPLARPDDEFLNVGFGFATYLGQVGLAPAFNDDVELPRYRFRFYADAARTRPVTDLPPIPVTASGDVLDSSPAVDERGAPIVGPNRAPQLFSTDPGRAAISGDPADFEAFDMPPLRGIARTAPYFHDNSHATLMDVVDSYSRFVLSAITPLNLPRQFPAESANTPPEALSVQQKHDLIAFLRRL